MADENELADRYTETEAIQTEEPEVDSVDNEVEEPQERNWKALRESAELMQRERDQYKKGYETLSQVLQSLNPQQKEVAKQPEEEDSQVIIDRVVAEIGDEDDYPSPAAFKKALKDGLRNAIDISEKRSAKIARQVYEEMNRGPNTASKYSDFNQVVTPENFDRLIKNNKVIYSLIERSENPYEAAYEYIKNHKDYSNSYDLVSNDTSQRQKEIREKMKKNSSTPKLGPANTRSIAESVSNFRNMTQDQKMALVQETERHARRM